MKKYIIFLLILVGVYWFINHRADQPSAMTATDVMQVAPEEDNEEIKNIVLDENVEDLEDVTPPLILNGDVSDDEDVQDSDLGIEVELENVGQDGEVVVVEPEYE